MFMQIEIKLFSVAALHIGENNKINQTFYVKHFSLRAEKYRIGDKNNISYKLHLETKL